MQTNSLPTAKASRPGDRSVSIVVSFQSDWYESLTKLRFQTVIRKRGPTNCTPHWIYAYVNSPKSALCAKAEILTINNIPSGAVIEMASELDMSKEQILDYVGNYESVYVYRLGQIYFPKREPRLHEIRQHLIFHPPQSFFFLSQEGMGVLDELCGF